MPVTVIDEIVPKNNGLFPVVRDTNTLGGWRAVADVTARNNISAPRRAVGMRCNVVSTGKLYELRGGIDNANWVEITEGSVTIADGRISMTTSAITMHVNPTTGASPPDGTIIHNQAEYDALGYPLLYVQDAIDILPIGIGHHITVWLDDGNHLAKPNDRGYLNSPVSLLTKKFIGTSEKVGSVSYLYPPYGSMIYFRGVNKTVVYSGSGTAGSRGAVSGITPGGMTADQYIGKLLIFTSGANAGQIMPIRTNGTDYLNGPPKSISGGACTFDIYEPSAVVLASVDGINRSTLASALMQPVSTGIYIENLKFGTTALPYTSINFLNQTDSSVGYLAGCICNMGTSNSFGFSTRATDYVFDSALHFAGGEIYVYNDATPYFSDCLLYGNFDMTWGLFDIEGGSVILSNCMIQVDDSYTGNIFRMAGAQVCFSGESWMWNQSKGVVRTYYPFYFYDFGVSPQHPPSTIVGYYVYLNGAKSVVYMQDSTVNFLDHYTFIHQGNQNDILWEIRYSELKLSAFETNSGSNAGLVADIRMDGIDYPFSLFRVPTYGGYSQGLEVNGQYGSKLKLSNG